MNEIGLYQALRRTVYASTIPHLREERFGETEIPLLGEEVVKKVTEIVNESIGLKDKRREIIMKVRNKIDEFLVE